MRKIIIVTLILLLASNIKAQQTIDILGEWQSNDLNYLKINENDTAWLSHNYGSYPAFYSWDLKDSVLTMIKKFIRLGPKGRSERFETLSFKIIQLNEDSLTLNPLDKFSKLHVENDYNYSTAYYENKESVFVNTSDLYIFTKKKKTYTRNFIFERLFLYSTPCYGSCPFQEIEIDSIGNVSFIGKMYTEPYIGKYSGKLSSSQLNNLTDMLNSHEIEKIPDFLSVPIDAPYYVLIVNYNGVQKVIEGSQFPYVNRELIQYLVHLFEELNLINKAKPKFKLRRQAKKIYKPSLKEKIGRKFEWYRWMD